MSNDPLWKYKAIIGATGGLSLSILKLMEAKFFVADVSSQDAIAAYLTYFGYIFLGIMVSVIFTESEQSIDRVRKHAFTMGLLAPSLLLAVIAQPVKRESDIGGTLKNIPRLGSWFVESAHAQGYDLPIPKSQRPPAAPFDLTVTVTELKKTEVDSTFKESVLKALGREGTSGPYLYVVGSSGDKNKALKAASEINSILEKAGEIKAGVVKPEGSQTLYVILNRPASATETLKINNAAKAAAVEALQKDTKQETVRAATLLLEGEVIKARLLFE